MPEEQPTCKKAIIATAGNGTRYLPVTKTIEKVMIPLVSKPVIHYIVKDCFDAGIHDFTFIITNDSTQIEDYFSHNKAYEDQLVANNKLSYLRELNEIIDNSTFTYIRQAQGITKPYGTTVPLSLALNDEQVKISDDESFIYLYGDNVYYDKTKQSTVGKFLQAARAINVSAAMLVVAVPEDQVDKYGIVALKQGSAVPIFDHIVEKPAIGSAPSNLNNGGIFLFKRNIQPFVEQSMELNLQKEKYITDAANLYAQAGNDILVHTTDSQYLDCGTPEGNYYATGVLLGAKNS